MQCLCLVNIYLPISLKLEFKEAQLLIERIDFLRIRCSFEVCCYQ